jgi:hypothetical protein
MVRFLVIIAHGLEFVMLTGDNRGSAAAVARQLGLDAVEIEPAGKVARVKKLRAEGEHVAMAGDGINDAPALSEAEIGIAKAIRLSRATMRNIRQNLFFAFLCNPLRIPVAAARVLPVLRLDAQPDDCRRCDGPEFRLGNQQRLAAAETETVIELRNMTAKAKTLTPAMKEVLTETVAAGPSASADGEQAPQAGWRDWLRRRGVGKFLAVSLVLAAAAVLVVRLKFVPVPVAAREIQAAAIAAEVMGTGTLEARVKTTIRPRLRERLAEVLVDQNALVTAGQLLARLDDGELKLQVEVAASALAAAHATAERVRVDEARAQAVEKLARLDHQRVSELLITKVSSQGEFDKTVEQLHVAEADLKRTQAAIV